MKISPSYPLSQVYSEINWIDRKMEEVREEMKRRPRKWRQLKDLQRQRDERTSLLNG